MCRGRQRFQGSLIHSRYYIRKPPCNLITISPQPRFHPYPNCTSTQVCKMGRKSNCVSCELLANSFSNVSTALYGQHFFRFFQRFFKTGWILVTKIVFSPISQFFAISPFGPSRKSNCVMLRFALRKMNYVSSKIAF